MTNPTRTRAEIQAEIEKLQAELDSIAPTIPEGTEVWVKAIVCDTDEVDGEYTLDIVGCGSPTYAHRSDIYPDLIPREEHERMLAEALDKLDVYIDDWGPGIEGKLVNASINGKIIASKRLGDMLESEGLSLSDLGAPDHIVDANKMVEPEPVEPVGYANLFSDGRTWSGVYNTPDGAERATGNVKCTETAVPLYRRPFDPAKTLPAGCRDGVDYVVREYVLDDCDRGAQRRYIRDWEGQYYTVTVQRRETEEPPRPVAVAPKGVVELLKEAFRAYGKAKAKSYDHSAIATAERLFQSHISKITELPEPGGEVRIDRTPANYDVATIILRSGFMLKFDQAEDALQLAADSVKAAALLAKEAE